ncbi:uncharacterized protein LOC117761842 isoform X7 [Hippoglossus hippoglossus]|uniref:uncharacterized protein LOC117761842 isoform X6 n=1 Tax=Hippoglossus hippoglossus TaxID=8267 RepID=UPI00148C4FB4|nr:uncharacterized protein LOC117761842 isoform X6 [Hippoglossus hippoglossus]XP_034442028.1 uncharacterized protein LOC117761842 isoform X7 [Hippoglossus hippoglossus]
MVGLVLFIVFITGSFHEIQIQALLQPKLVVSRPVITEKDTVTLDCQCPPDAIQCYFYTEGGETKISSCQKTLSGSELLLLAGQSSPAEVKVRCFYAVRSGDRHPPSPHSEISSITIHKTVEIESHTMQTTQFPMTSGPPTSTPVTSIKGLTVSTRNPMGNVISTLRTPVKVASDMMMWTLRALAVTAAFAVTVGFISLGLTFLCTTRRSGTEKPNRQEPQYEQWDIYHQYDTISEELSASVPNNMVYSTLQPI